jgi:predicted PurR-regulated permease PerM
LPKVTASPAWQRAQVIQTGTIVAIAVTAALYWAQIVFIPVALAVFLTFLLTPLVLALQKRGLGRISSVVLVVSLSAVVLGGTVWLVTLQISQLVAELPNYTDNIKRKALAVRDVTVGTGGGGLGQVVREVTGAFEGRPADAPGEGGASPAGPTAPPADEPAKVIVQPQGPGWLSRLPAALSPALEPLGAVALAVVLAVFMLLKREDLRNRFIRLVGHGRMTVTTKAVDDAGARISRLLLMQVAVNGSYGLAWGVGLYAIGVDYALLWGFLAAVLRYVPYVGAPIAAILPIALSLAQFPGWWQLGAVVGVLVCLELVSNNVIEPWLYGQSIGVSEVAMLIAAAFWTFLWGSIGLVLSGPLTVCLVVLGKHVPALAFFDVLLGDEPALTPDVTYYQRLLAGDQDEAAQIALGRAAAGPAEQVYDEVVVPALTYARRDRQRDEISEADEQFVLRATREIAEDLGERRAEAAAAADPADGKERPEPPPSARVRLLGCPGRDDVDVLALECLRKLLDPDRWDVDVVPSDVLSAELVGRAVEAGAAVICIASLPPGGLSHARYLCKRLRTALPDVKILVGRWGLKGGVEQNRELLREAGADQVATSLLETRTHLTVWLPILGQGAAVTAG